jgi:hypothetical protein
MTSWMAELAPKGLFRGVNSRFCDITKSEELPEQQSDSHQEFQKLKVVVH